MSKKTTTPTHIKCLLVGEMTHLIMVYLYSVIGIKNSSFVCTDMKIFFKYIEKGEKTMLQICMYIMITLYEKGHIYIHLYAHMYICTQIYIQL